MVWNARRNFAAELRWRLIVAVSGVTASMTACAGRSEHSENGAGSGGTAASSATGGAGGSGAKGGNATGGSSIGGSGGTGHGGTVAAGGSSSGKGGAGGSSGAGTGGTVQAGAGGAAGAGLGGTGGSVAGTPNGGQGNVHPHGCVEVDDDTGAYESCEGTFAHHPANVVCPLSPHPDPGDAGGAPSDGSGGAGDVPPEPPVDQRCVSDLDCTAADEGYCIRNDSGQFILVDCLYACTKDVDCKSGEVCSCEDSFLSEVSRLPLTFGVCKPAVCASDAECGAGLLCISPVQAACSTPRPGEFRCQSPEDECGGPGDCPPAKGECMYREDHYVCEPFPTCGRPFLVDGALRRSALDSDASWLDPALAAEPFVPLTAELRTALAEHWARAGLMEHASVAAFARFALQLMALGAPAELVAAATDAMADETRHARLCFGLASRYAGRALGPGPLDVTGALGAVELMDVVELVLDEGCIGETSAALEAAWAADAATDPVVASTLRGIARDEARHAELAWRFVAWASTRDGRVAGRVEARLREALHAARDAAARDEGGSNHPTDPVLAAHGVLDATARRAALLAALGEVLPNVVERLAA